MKTISMIVVVSLLLVSTAFAQTTSRVRVLDRDVGLDKIEGGFIPYEIEPTHFIAVNTEEAWVFLMKKHFPNDKPREIMGVHICYRWGSGGKREHYILMPTYKSHYQGRQRQPYEELMITMGHEVLHVIDSWVGSKVWNPDEMETQIKAYYRSK